MTDIELKQNLPNSSVSPLLLNAVLGDLYLHMPRGSNNRLNENSGPRRNGNRMFDSQNNNNGGYNVGDATKDVAKNMGEQHKEIYFQSGTVGKSYLTVEWTNQHGCGAKNPDDTNAIDCHMVLAIFEQLFHKCLGLPMYY